MLPAPCADHPGQHRARDEPRALEVDVEHAVPLGFVDRVGGAEARHAGRVHQHVDRAEVRDDAVDGRVAPPSASRTSAATNALARMRVGHR